MHGYSIFQNAIASPSSALVPSILYSPLTPSSPHREVLAAQASAQWRRLSSKLSPGRGSAHNCEKSNSSFNCYHGVKPFLEVVLCRRTLPTRREGYKTGSKGRASQKKTPPLTCPPKEKRILEQGSDRMEKVVEVC